MTKQIRNHIRAILSIITFSGVVYIIMIYPKYSFFVIMCLVIYGFVYFIINDI